MDESTFTRIGAGVSYIQSKLLQPKLVYDQSTTHSNEECNKEGNIYQDHGPTLSEPAKHILMKLLEQEGVHLNNYRPGRTSQIQYNTNISKTCNNNYTNMTIVHPNMSEQTILDLAYQQQISLLGSILSVIDEYPKLNTVNRMSTAIAGSTTTSGTGNSNTSSTSVPTKYIVQKCAYTVIPQKTPGLLSAREMITAALHFLSQEYPVNTETSSSSDVVTENGSYNNLMDEKRIYGHDNKINNIISLPLIRSVSMPSDLERRSYEKSYTWDLSSLLPQIFHLEDHFYNDIFSFTRTITNNSNNNNAATPMNCFKWLPREMFLPRHSQFKDTELHRKLLYHLSIPNSITDTTAANNLLVNNPVNHNIPKKRKLPSSTTTKSLPLASTAGNTTKRKEGIDTGGRTVKKVNITLSSKKIDVGVNDFVTIAPTGKVPINSHYKQEDLATPVNEETHDAMNAIE